MEIRDSSSPETPAMSGVAPHLEPEETSQGRPLDEFRPRFESLPGGFGLESHR